MTGNQRSPTTRLRRLDLIRQSHRLAWEAAPGWMMLGWAIAIIQSALGLASLYFMKLMIDAVGAVASEGAGQAATVWSALSVVGALAAVGLASTLCFWLGWMVNEVRGQYVTDHVQAIIQRQSIAMEVAYYENFAHQDTLHRVQQEGPYRPALVVFQLGQAAQAAVTLIALGAFLAVTHWGLALALVATAVPGMVLRMRHDRRMFDWQRDTTAAQRSALYLHMLVTAPAAAKEVRLFGLGKLFIGRFQDERDRLRRERLRIARRHGLANMGMSTGTAVVAFAANAFIAYHAFQGSLTLGGLVMYYQAFQRGQGALGDFFSSLAGLHENSLFLTNLFDFLDLRPGEEPADIAAPRPGAGAATVQHGIAFEDVSFAYPGSARKALDGVSLFIRPGEHLALVGANGSGKTTLVKLLCRLYVPSAGRITIDGVDLQAMEPAALHDRIRVVFQDFIRYHFSARENIWLGDAALPLHDARVVEAARAADADTVIAGLPRGYDTILSNWLDNGEDLSVGEWQRIAVARAFLKPAPIVILDEPTSALDAQTESDILRKLQELSRDRISILISHRFSTVRGADRVVVLDAGRIAEVGSHDELMARGGTYARMFDLQASNYMPSQRTPACA